MGGITDRDHDFENLTPSGLMVADTGGACRPFN
jgi:hypothetical protein